MVRFASDAAQPQHAAHVRFAAKALDHGLDDFALIVDERFLHTRSRDKKLIFDALAKDQLVSR